LQELIRLRIPAHAVFLRRAAPSAAALALILARLVAEFVAGTAGKAALAT